MTKTETEVLLLLLVCVASGLEASAAATIEQDTAALRALMNSIKNTPLGWGRSNDPCGPQAWEGVTCNGSRVTKLKLYNTGLRGTLSGDIGSLSALQILDLSHNKEVGGQLTPAIGNLEQLNALILVHCSFSGSIPSQIGNLAKLTYLALNSNQFTGNIPASLGSIPNLTWIDLGDNQLNGPLPLSNGSTPGLNQLVNTKHFHFNKNRLSGPIPEKLFSSDMKLKHLLLDRNQLLGPIPASIGAVKTLEIIRLDNNHLGGTVPSNINNLTSLHVLRLANNGLTGPIPNLTGMGTLNVVDLSHNSFDPSEAPAWISELENLTTLIIKSAGLHGQLPQKLFSLPILQQVILMNNSFSGTLDMGSNISEQLEIVNFENNDVTSVTLSSSFNNSILFPLFPGDCRLSGNPICSNINLLGTNYCQQPQKTSPAYSTSLSHCDGKSCDTNNTCSHPYGGIMFFRSPFFLDLTKKTALQLLEKSLWEQYGPTLASVSLQNPFFDNDTYLEVRLVLCPSNGSYFNIKDILEYLDLSSSNYKAPMIFGPLDFGAFPYVLPESSDLNMGLIVGLAVGSAVLVVLVLAGAGSYAFQQKKLANLCLPAKETGQKGH